MSPSAPKNHSGAQRNAPETANQRVSAGQPPAEPRLLRLAELIAASPHNLVARNERPHVFERHIAECDTLATMLAPTGRWMDLGTGGGLPGLVLALRHPDAAWTLVDATVKKVDEVRRFATELDLPNVEAVQGRAESLAHEPTRRGRFHGVVARAVAPLATLMELVRGFLQPAGTFVAVKGPAVHAELKASTPVMRTLGLRLSTVERLAGDARESWVVTMLAEGAPPAGYPRRDGVPKSDPLH